MPIYLSTIEEGRSNEDQRTRIAECITEVHVDVTGAPAQFVNTFFAEHADEEGGFRELPGGKVIFVNGNIRSGRSDEAKADMVERITQGIVDALNCEPEEVDVSLNSGPASHGMEGGKILPAPGSPEEQAWKEMGHA